ncbi:MAG: hypothetical protein H6844_15300 [Alphaproteobacteria bacterium]|nr:hypothetical protein [Alphaproteobacteria bacterium]
MSDGPEQEPGAPALAQCHLLVTGKLIRGHNPDGPIRPGTEHRVTGMSSGFPLWLQSHCTPESFFKLWGGVTAVDAGRFDGGAFVYRPLRTRRDGRVKYYGLFARIQARSEGGKGQPGRRYTHCAALVVEDDWRPETIAWAARLLFAKWPDEGCLGDPNTERQADRLELKLPALDPAACPALPDVCGLPWHAKAIGEGEDFAAEHACQSRACPTSRRRKAPEPWAPICATRTWLSEEGRWLSIRSRGRAGAIGVNDGFALIGDDREGRRLAPCGSGSRIGILMPACPTCTTPTSTGTPDFKVVPAPPPAPVVRSRLSRKPKPGIREEKG